MLYNIFNEFLEDIENLDAKLKTENSIDAIFRQAQGAFNAWSKLPIEFRTPNAIIEARL